MSPGHKNEEQLEPEGWVIMRDFSESHALSVLEGPPNHFNLQCQEITTCSR